MNKATDTMVDAFCRSIWDEPVTDGNRENVRRGIAAALDAQDQESQTPRIGRFVVHHPPLVLTKRSGVEVMTDHAVCDACGWEGDETQVKEKSVDYTSGDICPRCRQPGVNYFFKPSGS